MESLEALLKVINNLSPLGIIALLGVVIFMLVRNRPASAESVDEIKENHLHHLPEMAESLRRIETKLTEDLTYIKTKLNGK